MSNVKPSILGEICQVFGECSSFINEWIAEQPSVGEESITDWLLYSLSKQSKRIRYYKFSRTEESRRTGADWEWWFLFDAGAWGARVQAKRLRSDQDNYDGIHYKPKNNEFQLKQLVANALKSHLMPLYAYYVGDPSTITQCRFNSLSAGVFLCSAERVEKRWSPNVRTPFPTNELLAESVPLSCFACCNLITLEGFKGFLRRYFLSVVNNYAFHAIVPNYVRQIDSALSDLDKSRDWQFVLDDGVPNNINGIVVLDYRSQS